MKPADLANRLGTSALTIRRWSKDFADYLSPGATPPRGEQRLYDVHDQRVMLLISELRNAGMGRDAIINRLEAEKRKDYHELPDLPPGWSEDDTVSLGVASARASEMVTIATLQTQLQHVNQRLAEATERVESLQAELNDVRASKGAVEGAQRAIELELAQARGEVEVLKARLAAYSLGMSEKPVPAALLIVAALLAGALLVTLAFVVARLVM